MPYLMKDKLLVRVASHASTRVDSLDTEGQTKDKNHIFYVADGTCNITVSGKSTKVGQRTLVYIAREVDYQIHADKKDRCLLYYVEIAHSDEDPHLDLQELCRKSPLVDTFMSGKAFCCFLIDCENMYVTIGELLSELEADRPEKQQIMGALLTTLYIKMARSFHLHGKSSGIQYITEAKRFIFEHCDQELSVKIIADHLGISRSYLQILFSRYGKRNIVEHISGVRIDRAAYMLATTDMSIIDVALSSGFNSRQHFARVFQQHVGLTPRDYRKRSGKITINCHYDEMVQSLDKTFENELPLGKAAELVIGSAKGATP